MKPEQLKRLRALLSDCQTMANLPASVDRDVTTMLQDVDAAIADYEQECGGNHDGMPEEGSFVCVSCGTVKS